MQLWGVAAGSCESVQQYNRDWQPMVTEQDKKCSNVWTLYL